jgi:hypothetical protein
MLITLSQLDDAIIVYEVLAHSKHRQLTIAFLQSAHSSI